VQEQELQEQELQEQELQEQGDILGLGGYFDLIT
jgi:hypothetical protein